jgi:hypothetical protein
LKPHPNSEKISEVIKGGWERSISAYGGVATKTPMMNAGMLPDATVRMKRVWRVASSFWQEPERSRWRMAGTEELVAYGVWHKREMS